MNRYRFLASLLWQHKTSYLVGGAMVGLTLWMTLAIPQFLQQAVDILATDPDPGGEAFLTRIGWIFLLAVAIIFTRSTSRIFFFVPGRKVEFDLKNRLLTHLSTLQRNFFLVNPTGGIISRINNDINGIRMMMGFGLMQLVGSLSMLSMAPARMYELSPTLTFYVAVPISAAFVVMQVAVRRLRGFQLEQMKLMQELSDFTVESYNGIDVLKTYRAAAWAEAKFGGVNDAVKRATLRMAVMRAFFVPILVHIVNALKVLLMLMGGMMVIRAELTMGEFLAYSLYLTMLVPPLMGMTFMMFVLQRGMTALTSLEAIFNTQPDLPPVNEQAERALPRQLRTGLQLRHLNYAYPDAPAAPVLRDVSFAVRPGEIVGVFGHIGSGKTTLVNVINRYLNPPAGQITLEGIDTTEISLHRLRESIVTVSQEPFLFSDSIRENISFANEQAEPAAVDAAVQAAALGEDLKHFPGGLETLVGERGITLSGGQKQRIALARSLLKPCDLLILDDVLAAVDHETERYLIGQIYGFRHARSLLIVSHRISVLERADRIVVLEDGRMSGEATHQEWIARDGIYRTAWQLQSEQGAGRPETSGEAPREKTGKAAN